MIWSMKHPVLFFLPAIICFILHILVSSGLLVQARAGFYRLFVYVASSLFLIFYLLIFNHGYTMGTTRVTINYQGQYISFSNQYGSLQIPRDSIQAVVVESRAHDPDTVWVVSEQQVFYLDRNFANFAEFFPALAKMVDLGQPSYLGETTIYRRNRGISGEADHFRLDFRQYKNKLQGNTVYYLPWLGIMPFFFYKLGPKAWGGRFPYFIYQLLLYGVPLLSLLIFFKPALPLVIFILFYPFCLFFYSAMCVA